MINNHRNTRISHDTEDRAWWYIHGQLLEDQFVQICRNKLNIDAEINPQKSHDNTAPDLLVSGVLADLKTQNTPFFTAGRYGMDPRFTVTFNRKDYDRYNSLYPEIAIYFWIDWAQTQYRDIQVDYLGGIFTLPFHEVSAMIDNGVPEHHYARRTDPSDRNAKSSFLLDIRRFDALFLTETQKGAF
ncbi:hypothetical protein [Burkholderia puraquae]|uniref:hypothetical protein n=1 Tax=Burkholderia puraquae TaxID=1904757 RepID=UPI0010557734|nr:hypothetical protein [Burkholderia puraquae]